MKKTKAIKVPREIKFLLCDDLRREESGKLVLIGLYPGELVILNNAVPNKEKKLVGVIQALCFAFIASKGHGVFDTSLKVTAPNGAVVFDHKVGQLNTTEETTATVAGIVRPFLVHAFGVHKALLTVGKANFERVFEVRKGKTLEKAKPPSSAK